MSQDCKPGVFLFTQTSRIRGKTNVSVENLHTAERYALNGKGALGSLYDARTDNLLSTPSINKNLKIQQTVKEKPTCEFKRIDRWNQKSLLKLIDIDANLRLSIILNMTSVTEGTLMLYNYEIPTDRTVRLISYFHICEEEHLINDAKRIREYLQNSCMDKNATHIITKIERGLDFVIVLEYPTKTNNDEMDLILKELCEYFVKSDVVFSSSVDQEKLDTLKFTIFTSNNKIRSLPKNRSFADNCKRIHQISHQNVYDYPLLYTMHPVKCVYDENLFDIKDYQQIDRTIVEKIEEILSHWFNEIRRISWLFKDARNSLSQHVKHFYEEIQNDFTKAEETYSEILKAFITKVISCRKGSSQVDFDKEADLNNSLFGSLKSELKILQVKTKCYQARVYSINQLKIDCHVEYFNVADLEKQGDTQEILEAKVLSTAEKSRKYYLCFAGELVENDFYELLKTKLDQINASTHLVLADFSNCSCKLKSMKILRTERARNIVKPKEINVLLVGETGVGKSTFINAFVNYLAFHSFEQAANNEPIVLIPASFVITTGDQFVEHKIEFGQIDPNEKHNDTGESVTQRCKSYLFNLKDNLKLRIIDTPGLGDTRGVEQDDKNIEQILTYTSNVPYLNAICFLLKPNTTRLHVLFRSCFTQLFNFLGPNARENIIFCFTNTRATFYTPGNTVKPLKEMLKILPDDHTPPFAKSNTFCFDSESFRYLAVIKAGHQLAFDEQQKLDFKQSWEKSATESIRLLDYVKTRPEYEMNNWKSIKHAQIKIAILARPIIETIRNALRNLIMWKLGKKQLVLQIKAEPINELAWICTNCPYKTAEIQKILMVAHPKYGHRITDKCSSCSCPLDKHLPVFYELHYDLGSIKGMKFDSETENMKNRLLDGCILLSHFLLSIAQISDNPFLRWINLFIKEQEYLCTKDPSASVNFNLSHSLHQLKDQYETRLLEMLSSNEQYDLNIVYNRINELLKYSEVFEQMTAIQKSQMNIMKNSESIK